jgi:nucleoside phosphorylase
VYISSCWNYVDCQANEFVFWKFSFCPAQLNQLKAEADQAARLESAAKAVLREAQRAAREGRSLTAAELSSIRTPILNPPTAEELDAERKAAEQVCTIQTTPALGVFGRAVCNMEMLNCSARSYSC